MSKHYKCMSLVWGLRQISQSSQGEKISQINKKRSTPQSGGFFLDRTGRSHWFEQNNKVFQQYSSKSLLPSQKKPVEVEEGGSFWPPTTTRESLPEIFLLLLLAASSPVCWQYLLLFCYYVYYADVQQNTLVQQLMYLI